jgi:hypothetical protein
MGAKKKTPRKRSRTAARPRRAQPTKANRRKPRARKRAPRPKKPRKRAAPRVGHESVESLEQKVRRLRSARARLERRLTEAVQEIGTLRRFELRVRMLEGELRKRDEEFAAVRRELDSVLGGSSATAVHA